jgi:hypothetical protein
MTDAERATSFWNYRTEEELNESIKLDALVIMAETTKFKERKVK